VLLGVGALLCFGAAQIVGRQWFLPALGVALLIAIAGLAVWLYRKASKGELDEAVASVAQHVVPVLDDAYDTASAEIKEWLDANVFDRLSSGMDKITKAAVHLVREEQAKSQ
jgi:cbb3-type cytochrome oxidase subunit 3